MQMIKQSVITKARYIVKARVKDDFHDIIYGSNSTWLDSTRLDTFDFVEQVETSETSRALPTWRTTNDLVQV